MSLSALPLLLSLTASTPATPLPAADAPVRIYRCVASNGQVAMQDHPCLQGRQEVSEWIRPRDPPPPPPAAPAAAAPATASPVQRVVVVSPRPLFECHTPEGERYTADDGEGNPRWVAGPLVPVLVGTSPRPPGPPRHRPPGARPPHPRPGSGHGVASVLVPAGGQWVRDTCQPLTTAQACQVLGAQRWELIGRYNSALSSEREQLVREQRRVEQRMREQPCNQ